MYVITTVNVKYKKRLYRGSDDGSELNIIKNTSEYLGILTSILTIEYLKI